MIGPDRGKEDDMTKHLTKHDPPLPWPPISVSPPPHEPQLEAGRSAQKREWLLGKPPM